MGQTHSDPDVLIINSPLFRDKISGYDEDSLSPLGLGYIGTDLRMNGFNVELLDAVEGNIPLTEILETVRERRPSFVAMNVFTTNLHLVRELVESIDIETHLVIGGLATRTLRDQVLGWSTRVKLDLVHGDGDHIVTAIATGQTLECQHWEGNKRVIDVTIASPYFPHNISDLPLDRSLFPMASVQTAADFREAPIITSRGCIYNCAFCSAARSLNRDSPVRERNPESVAREISELCKMGRDITSIRVLDDLFLRDERSVGRAVEMFTHSPVTWRAMAHVLSFRKLSDSQLQELRQSGCREVFIGIEAGSPRILKMIHKTPDIDLIKNTIDRLFRVGIAVKGYLILGFNTETAEDMKMTYDLAAWLSDAARKRGSTFRTSVFQFRPYHGTELYTALQNEGRMIDEIRYDSTLSHDIGRKQFNFTGGNFSEASDEELQKFIVDVNALNQ